VVTFWLSFTIGYYKSGREREQTSKGMNASNNSNSHGIVTKDYSKIPDGAIISDTVSYGVNNNNQIHYLHCRRALNIDNIDGLELLMLHGAAFTADTWKTSGILTKLCASAPKSSIRSLTALDLDVSSDGTRLKHVFDALSNRATAVLSGERVVLVSPSASGKAVIDLAELAFRQSNIKADESDNNDTSNPGQFLTQIIKGWIPVACFAINTAGTETLEMFPKSGIPVMGIYGSKDGMGKRVTEKLVQHAGAVGHEIEGSHPCYLDSPDDFMDLVRLFVDSLGR